MNVRAGMFEPMKQIPKKVKEVKKFAAAGGSDGGDKYLNTLAAYNTRMAKFFNKPMKTIIK